MPISGQQNIVGGINVSAGIETFGISSGFPGAFSLLSTRKLHFALTVLPAGCVKLPRNEGAAKGRVTAGLWIAGKVLQNAFLWGSCSALKAQPAVAVLGASRGWEQQCQLPNIQRGTRRELRDPRPVLGFHHNPVSDSEQTL